MLLLCWLHVTCVWRACDVIVLLAASCMNLCYKRVSVSCYCCTLYMIRTRVVQRGTCEIINVVVARCLCYFNLLKDSNSVSSAIHCHFPQCETYYGMHAGAMMGYLQYVITVQCYQRSGQSI